MVKRAQGLPGAMSGFFDRNIASDYIGDVAPGPDFINDFIRNCSVHNLLYRKFYLACWGVRRSGIELFLIKQEAHGQSIYLTNL